MSCPVRGTVIIRRFVALSQSINHFQAVQSRSVNPLQRPSWDNNSGMDASIGCGAGIQDIWACCAGLRDAARRPITTAHHRFCISGGRGRNIVVTAASVYAVQYLRTLCGIVVLYFIRIRDRIIAIAINHCPSASSFYLYCPQCRTSLRNDRPLQAEQPSGSAVSSLFLPLRPCRQLRVRSASAMQYGITPCCCSLPAVGYSPRSSCPSTHGRCRHPPRRPHPPQEEPCGRASYLRTCVDLPTCRVSKPVSRESLRRMGASGPLDVGSLH